MKIYGVIPPEYQNVADTNVGKMTEQEAITHLETVINWNEDISVPEIEAVKLAIEALQKQIPTKLTHEAMPWGLPNYRIETCPFCKNSQDTEYPHCRYCGQALDWGDE